VSRLAEVGNLSVTLGLDTASFQRSIQDVNRKLKLAQSEFKAATAGVDGFEDSVEGLRKKSDYLSKTLQLQKDKVETLRAQYERLKQEKGENSKEAENMLIRLNKTIAAMKNTESQLKTANEQIEKQSSVWNKLGESLKQAGEKLKSVGESMKQVGKDLSFKVTTPIVGMGAAIIKTGADFEESMSKVAAISGATGKEFEALEEQAKELGATTRFSASEAASGMQFLAMAGFETNEILSAMPGLLDLAAASGMDLGRAADITSNIMSGFTLEASEAGHVSDVLAKAASSANTNVEQLGEAMKYLAPVSNSLGWSLEEATAAVMALSDAGLQGEQAGAAFSTSLTRLTNPSKEAAKVMKELNLEFFDAQGNMKSLPDVIKEVEEGTKGLTAEQKAAALSTIFGQEAYKAWAVLLESGSETLAENTDMLENADGAAKQMADTMSENTKGAWKEFQSAVEGLSIALSEHLLPIVNDVLGKLTEWARKFGELSPSTQKVILALAGIIAALGPILILIGNLVSSIGGAILVFGKLAGSIAAAGGLLPWLGGVLAALTGPIGIAIAAIAGLTVAGIALWKNWDTIKAKAIEIWTAIQEWFSTTLESIKRFFSNTWENIKTTTENTWNSIKEVVIAIVTPFVETVQTLFNNMKSGLETMFEGLKQYFNGVWELIKNIFLGAVLLIVDLVTGDFEGMKEHAKAIMENMKNALNDIWEGLKKVFSGAIEAIKGYFSTGWTIIQNTTSIVWNAIKTFISTAIENIKTFISTGFENVKQAVFDKMTAAKQSIVDIWNEAQEFLEGIDLVQIGEDIIQGLIDGLSNMAQAVYDKAKEIADKVKETIKGALGIESPSRVMREEVGKWIPIGLAQGIEQNIDAIKNATNKMTMATVPDFRGTPNVQNTYKTSYGNVYVTIPVNELRQIQDINDFFTRLGMRVKQA
jgi:TP901 family phage tail tape measure protein